MTHGELFAGIGGFSEGFAESGITTVWAVEIENDCQDVATLHAPEVQRFKDVRDVGVHNLPYVDIITFGSPCQDLSIAGKRKGFDGARSGLFFEAIRIIRECKPAFAVWENVPGALSSESGRDFYAAIKAMAELGADVSWRTLDAQYFGVPQRRRRIFAVLDIRGECAGEILFESESMSRHSESRRTAGEDITTTPTKGSSRSSEDGLNLVGLQRKVNHGGYVGSETSSPLQTESCASSDKSDLVTDFKTDVTMVVTPINTQIGLRGETTSNSSREGVGIGKEGDPAFTLQASHGHAVGIWQMRRSEEVVRVHGAISPTLVRQMGTGGHNVPMTGVRRLTPLECERLQGFPDNYTAKGASGKAMSDSARYRMLGNAVNVRVSAWIGKRIIQQDKE
jgi:DNA (cytosine-5)-methyltransferase 1